MRIELNEKKWVISILALGLAMWRVAVSIANFFLGVM
jgi:hypothetical protein